MYRTIVLTLFVVFCELSRAHYDHDIDLASGQIEANLNEYMDLVMVDASPWIINNGLDPLRLHDITNQFEYKPMFVSFHGHLDLTNGLLHNLRNISRSGNSVMQYGHKSMRIETELTMTNLNFRYDYDVNVMNFGPSGWIDGSVTNVTVHADFMIDLIDFYIDIQEFRVTSIGRLDVMVRGNILVDWLGNVIVKMVTLLFKSIMVDYISTQVHEMAQITVDGINSRMSIYDRREVAAKFFNDIEIKTMLIL